MRILDVGCGSGKQCFLYSDTTGRKANITGGDLSKELLERARATNVERGDAITFQYLDFNKKFEFSDGTFDLVSSAFAIYYAADLQFTFGEAHRVLKPAGRLFVTGPLPENKRMFYEIIQEAAQKPIPPMPGSSRFRTEIYSTIAAQFSKTDLLTFENPITFPAVEPFMAYVMASLSEDRKLWTSMFGSGEEYTALIQQIRSGRGALASEGRQARHDESGRRDPRHQVGAVGLPPKSLAALSTGRTTQRAEAAMGEECNSTESACCSWAPIPMTSSLAAVH